jgi:hypothetical protein
MDGKYHIKNFGFVLVSHFVILDRHPVTEMYRREPNPDIPFSGWAFLTGREEKELSLPDGKKKKRTLTFTAWKAYWLQTPRLNHFFLSQSARIFGVSTERSNASLFHETG